MPKRARLQPTTTAGPTAQKPAAPTLRFTDTDADRSSISFSSSPSSSPASPSQSASAPMYANRPSALAHSGPSTTTASRPHVARPATSGSSDSVNSDGDSDVDEMDVFFPRYHYHNHNYHTRSRSAFPRRVVEFPRLRLERSTAS